MYTKLISGRIEISILLYNGVIRNLVFRIKNCEHEIVFLSNSSPYYIYERDVGLIFIWSLADTKNKSYLNLKIYTTLDYIVSLILLFNAVNLLLPTDTYGWRCESETRVPSSRGLVKQYNQELCISLITRCFTKRLQSRPFNWFVTSVLFWSHLCGPPHLR